jgi:hypothetical protein
MRWGWDTGNQHKGRPIMDRWIVALEYEALFECLFDRQTQWRVQSKGESGDDRRMRPAATDSREALKTR